MTTPLLYALTLGSLTVASYLSLLLWRRRGSQAARPLLVVAVLLGLGLVVSLVLYVPGPLRSAWITWTGVEFVYPGDQHPLAVVVTLVGAFWFLFALRYTGRGTRITARVFGLLAVLVGTLLGVGVFGEVLLDQEVAGVRPLESAAGISSFVVAVLTLLGVGLVLETAWERNGVGLQEATLLGGGALAFLSPGVLGGLIPSPAVPTATAGLSCLLFVAAIHRHAVFEALPAARIAGRDRLIEEMRDGVLIVDREGRIRDLNEAAAETISMPQEAARGQRLPEVLPGSLDAAALVKGSEPVHVETRRGRRLAVAADRVTDLRDRPLGHVISCRDVTVQHRRDQRLSVLHRLLTDVVRDRMRAVSEDAAGLRAALEGDEPESNPAVLAADVQRTGAVLTELVREARAVEELLRETDRQQVEISRTVRDQIEGMNLDSIDVGPADPVVATTDPDAVQTAIGLLVKAAGSAASVSISVERTGHGPEIHVVTVAGADAVSDDGGNVADGNDRGGGSDTVERVRRETALDLARLAVESTGGTVTTVDAGPGHAAVVRLLPADTGGVEGR